MTRTATILKAMQAVVLVTVLTPATVFAGSLSQPVTQTQQQGASAEAKHIKRSLILTPAEAATNTAVAPQVEIPALPPRHDEAPADTAATSNYSTAAAPTQTTSTEQSSSIVTLPVPAQPASTVTSAPVTNTATDATVAPAQVAPAPVPAASAAVQTTPAPAATPVAAPAATTASVTTTPATTTPSTTAPVKTAQSRSRLHSNDSFNVGGFDISSGNIERQARKFFNRRDVKSALAQFGLN